MGGEVFVVLFKGKARSGPAVAAPTLKKYWFRDYLLPGECIFPQPAFFLGYKSSGRTKYCLEKERERKARGERAEFSSNMIFMSFS